MTQTSAGLRPDTLFTVQVSCTIRGLSFLGLTIAKTVTSTSAPHRSTRSGGRPMRAD